MGKFANCNTTAHLNNKYKLHFDEKKLDLLFLVVFCSSLFCFNSSMHQLKFNNTSPHIFIFTAAVVFVTASF